MDTAPFDAPLELVIDAVKAAGFCSLDVRAPNIGAVEGGAKAAAKLLQVVGVDAPTYSLLRDYEGSGTKLPERLEQAEALMDDMVEIGASTLLMCANADPQSSSDQMEQIRDLRRLADLAQSRGLRVGFEPLPWSCWIKDYEQANACVEAVNRPGFGLVLDVFHLFSCRTSLDILGRIALDGLFLVQLSNAVSMPLPTIDIARHHRRFPDDGEWPVPEVVAHLESRGYDGYYSVEVFNDQYKKQDPFAVATAAWQSMESLFVEDLPAVAAVGAHGKTRN